MEGGFHCCSKQTVFKWRWVSETYFPVCKSHTCTWLLAHWCQFPVTFVYNDQEGEIYMLSFPQLLNDHMSFGLLKLSFLHFCTIYYSLVFMKLVVGFWCFICLLDICNGAFFFIIIIILSHLRHTVKLWSFRIMCLTEIYRNLLSVNGDLYQLLFCLKRSNALTDLF